MATTTYNSIAGSVTSNTDDYVFSSIVLPSGRVALDGDSYVLITAMRAYVAGLGGSRTIELYLASPGNGPSAFSAASAGSAQDTGYRSCSELRNGGVSTTFVINGNGPFYFGRAPGSTGATDSYGTTWGPLYASMTWAEVPSAPTSLEVLAGSTIASLEWVTPADNGDSAITGYRIDYSTSPVFTTFSSKTVGVVTSDAVGSLTPGTTYYFRVCALNAVTAAAGTPGPASSTVSVFMGTVPDLPTSVVFTPHVGLGGVTWGTPAYDGGIPIDGYRVQVATDFAFTNIVATADVGPTVRAKTIVGLTPATTYYVQVRAHNSVGYGPASPTINETTLVRTTLDIVRAAAVHLADGTQVELRSDGASSPTIQLGYVAFGTGTTFNVIATIPVNGVADTFYAPSGPRNIALVTNPAGDLFLVGVNAGNTSRILVKRFERTGPTAWTLDGVLGQSLTNTGDPIVSVAATYVPGSGGSPVPTIFVLARRAGTIGLGALSYATLSVPVLEAGAGTLGIQTGSNPSWLSSPPSGSVGHNTGMVDVAPLVEGGTRIGLLGDGFAVVDVVNGVVTGVSRAANGTTNGASWGRVIGVDADTIAMLTASGSGTLAWTFRTAGGVILGSGTYAGANAYGGAFLRQWDAYLDRVADTITVYYVADPAGARTLESIDISASTYAASAAASLTAALGAASTINDEVRVPQRIVDERRVLVAASNIHTGTSAKTIATYVDTSGNVAPNAPALVDVAGFDASSAYTFGWAFSDDNSADTQTAYELQIQRVSDSVDIVATGKVVSTALTRVVNAATLVNGVNYRWRVRTWDALDTQGAWTSYDTFLTAALGTLTITDPAADDPVGYDEATVDLTWTYVQGDGYVQTQRRIRVLLDSDGSVLSDTTMQASVATSETVAIPTSVRVRIELSIVTNAPGTPTVTTTRYMTSDYATPMQPTVALSVGESFIIVSIDNPEPSGDRPEVVSNIIERRPGGTDDAFVPVAIVGHNGEYNDHAVRSATAYDYRVRGTA